MNKIKKVIAKLRSDINDVKEYFEERSDVDHDGEKFIYYLEGKLLKKIEIIPPILDCLEIAVETLKLLSENKVNFPGYDWSDWTGDDAQREAGNIIAQLASLTLEKIDKKL